MEIRKSYKKYSFFGVLIFSKISICRLSCVARSSHRWIGVHPYSPALRNSSRDHVSPSIVRTRLHPSPPQLQSANNIVPTTTDNAPRSSLLFPFSRNLTTVTTAPFRFVIISSWCDKSIYRTTSKRLSCRAFTRFRFWFFFSPRQPLFGLFQKSCRFDSIPFHSFHHDDDDSSATSVYVL